MKVLIVGCGAVGQVLGFYLRKSGANLCFLARPESAGNLKQALDQGGLPLFQISHFRRQDPVCHRLTDDQRAARRSGQARGNPDQIWFTTPSTVLHTPWFLEFLNKVPSKRVLCFPPEGERSEFYPEGGDKDRLVFGGITFIAWQGDLDGGGGMPEAVNYWLPPLIQIPLIGAEDACNEVAALIRKGGLRPSIQKAGFGKAQSSTSGLLSSFVAGLELSGWSFQAYRKSPWMKIAAGCSREAISGQLAGKSSTTRFLLELISSTAGFYLATLFLPLLFPFDFEKYLKFHYTKTREQTLSLLNVYINDGEKGGGAVGNIRKLLQGVIDTA